MAVSGLRRGEALGLKGKHVDSALRSIVIHKNTKTKRTGVTSYNGEVEALMNQYWNGRKPKAEEKFFLVGEGTWRKQLERLVNDLELK